MLLRDQSSLTLMEKAHGCGAKVITNGNETVQMVEDSTKEHLGNCSLRTK